jgi:hypothetical protein
LNDLPSALVEPADTSIETKTTQPTNTVLLQKTEFGVEVICPNCKQVIFTFQTERAAYHNTGKVAEHVAKCT